MVNPVSIAIAVAIVFFALAGMLWSWRRRRRGQGGLRLPAGAAAGEERAVASGTYLATTFAARPLDRVVVAGLGFRAAVRLAVNDGGLTVERAGARPFTVPTGRITGAGSGTWALDRSVERNGLLIVAWSLEDAEGRAVPVESAFRLDPAGQDAVTEALLALLPASKGA